MKREDIIRMARDAGIEVHARKGEIRIGSAAITGCDSTEQVTRFAAMVAAAEREACAELMERQHAWITNTAAANAIRARSNT